MVAQLAVVESSIGQQAGHCPCPTHLRTPLRLSFASGFQHPHPCPARTSPLLWPVNPWPSCM